MRFIDSSLQDLFQQLPTDTNKIYSLSGKSEGEA